MEGCLEFVHVSGLKAHAQYPGVWKSLRTLKQLYKPEPRLTEWSQALWSPSLLFSSVGPATSRCLETLPAGRGTPQQGPAQSWKPPPGSLLLWANASGWDLSFTSCPSHPGLSGCLCLLEKMNAGFCVYACDSLPSPTLFKNRLFICFWDNVLLVSNLWTTVILRPRPPGATPTALPGLVVPETPKSTHTSEPPFFWLPESSYSHSGALFPCRLSRQMSLTDRGPVLSFLYSRPLRLISAPCIAHNNLLFAFCASVTWSQVARADLKLFEDDLQPLTLSSLTPE